MKKRWLLTAVLAGLLVLGAQRFVRAQESPFLDPPKENPFAELMQRQPALNLHEPIKDKIYQDYLRFYNLDFKHVKHYGGYVNSGKEHVFVHVFRPEGQASRGTVVTMHGYFVHTGLIVHLIDALLQARYTVVAVDLPGHGLSSGERASIPDFGDYAHALARVTAKIGDMPGPKFLIGHSTGGAGSWEYLLKNRENPYQKLVLVAPLVRSAYWDLSNLGFSIGQGWLKELPRLVGPTSTDPTFFAMTRKDPLQYAGTPVQWVRALIDWNAHVIDSYPPTQTPLLIVQGTEDTVVDYTYNIPFLQRKFPQATIEMMPGARHDLLWEAPAIRAEAFAKILAFLKQK